MMKLTELPSGAYALTPNPPSGGSGEKEPSPPATVPVTPLSPSPTRRRAWIAGAAAAALIAVGAVGYTQLKSPPAVPGPSSSSGDRSFEAGTVRPVRQTLHKTFEQPGHVEAYEHTPMYVKMAGYVKEWKTDVGAWVKKGAVLAELTVPEEEEELKRREAVAVLDRAQVVAAEKALEAAVADEAKAEAVLRQSDATRARAEANVTRWKADFKRTEQAREKGAASQNDYDVSLDSLRTSEAALLEAKAGIESATAALASAGAAKVKAQAAVKVACAQVAVAEADARRQREWLNYSIIRAPFDGVVSERQVENGQYVMPPTSSSTQPPLFMVERTDTVRVFVDVPESEAVLVAENMPVMVRVQSRGDIEIPGRVSRMSWTLDRTSRTLRVQVDLPNADGTLRAGSFAVVRFSTERPGVWLVPAGVVVTTDEQPYAVRVENGKTIKTPVKLGARQGTMVELIQKQTHPVPHGEPIPWETLTGSEEFLTVRPAGWTDGMMLK